VVAFDILNIELRFLIIVHEVQLKRLFRFTLTIIDHVFVEPLIFELLEPLYQFVVVIVLFKRNVELTFLNSVFGIF
jgi:hypothetical protein